MKELDWIILTSWSAPPRTQQLQQAGLHCSLLSLYMCACETMVSPSHLHVDTASPTWMLIIFLIGFLDSLTSARDSKTTSLRSSFYAAMLFPDFAWCVVIICHLSVHLLSHSGDWHRPESCMTFVYQPSFSYPLSSLSFFTFSPSLY